MPRTTGTTRMTLTRRRLLWSGSTVAAVVGAGLAGVELEVLPGKASLYHHLGHDGADGVAPDVEPGRVDYGAFASRARGTDVGWALARPPGVDPGERLPVVVALHGRGQDHTSAFRRDRLALDRFLAALTSDGVAPFAVASVDGGETYWHDRASGDRAQTMVVEEFLPLLEKQGVSTARIGFVGWSMGGSVGCTSARRWARSGSPGWRRCHPPSGTGTTTRHPAPTTTPPTSTRSP